MIIQESFYLQHNALRNITIELIKFLVVYEYDKHSCNLWISFLIHNALLLYKRDLKLSVIGKLITALYPLKTELDLANCGSNMELLYRKPSLVPGKVIRFKV